MKFLLPFILLFFVLCSCVSNVPLPDSDGQPKIGYHIGNLAPDFSLPARDGSTFQLKSLRGKVVFLNFWATWCPPCLVEMPSMEKLLKEMKGKDFEMVAISVDSNGWAVIDPFVQKHQFSFKVVLDQKMEVAKLYKSYRFPETFLIDREGKIIDKRVGAANWNSPKMIKYFKELTTLQMSR